MTCRSTKLAAVRQRERTTLSVSVMALGSRQAPGLGRRVKRGALEPAWM